MNLKTRKLTNKFNNSIMDLEIILQEVEKINNNKRLGIKKAKAIIKKVLEEFKTEKAEELEWNLKFLTLKCRFFKCLNDYEEERKAREMTRKIMEEINIFETKIKKIGELIIDTIEYDYDKLIDDFKMKKGLEPKKIKKIEIKLEKLRISKTIIDAIKKSVISEKC